MPDRPNPLAEVASKVGAAWSAIHGLIGALVTFGVLSVAQGEAATTAGNALSPTLIAVGTVLGAVIPIAAGLVSAFRTVAAGKNHVTPVSSPRDNEGRVLVPTNTVPR